jgi:hypothetical protein
MVLRRAMLGLPSVDRFTGGRHEVAIEAPAAALGEIDVRGRR